MNDTKNATVIGAGLAGSEAAWQLARRGVNVTLCEMKPQKRTPAHVTDDFAELCCSNSLRSDRLENAVGLLKEELRRMGSLILACADETRVEAGGALAVDRHGFARLVTEKIRANPRITVVSGEVPALPETGAVIVASGPLTSDALAGAIARKLASAPVYGGGFAPNSAEARANAPESAGDLFCTGAQNSENPIRSGAGTANGGARRFNGDLPGNAARNGADAPEAAARTLHFFDAAAPLVTFESVDMDKAFFASRYDRGTADYINCPMNEAEYQAFWEALVAAEETPVHGFEDKSVFEGCMPVEVMARRGRDTLCYGPLKPRGLRDPRTGREPFAVAQLRRDNAEGTVYNLVGFQTHLRFPEQKRVFSMIPALRDAEFVRYGVMHRNTYLDSPRLLDRYYRLASESRIAFAGQMTGVEGYVESAASGFLAGVELARRLEGKAPLDFPPETAIGALALYVSNRSVTDFQPMNINFGIIPPLGYRVKGKRNKNAELSKRSLAWIDEARAELFSDVEERYI